MKLNCIIVEDNPVFSLMLKEMVQHESSDLMLVGVADSAEEAQELLEANSVDVILLDLGLPGMDGFELIESLKAPEDVQIILITGDSNHALNAFEYGVTDYIVKPISKERLEKAVKKAIRNHENRSKNERPENIIFKKLAEFMVSRNESTLEPIPLRFAKMGYAYPMLTANFDYEGEEKGLEILEEAEKEGLLAGEFVDSMYVCNSCYNSLLHFRETCINCKSSNLEAEDLVHHFSCAYMGPVSDFYVKSESNNMVCPKCEKTLNHIGVDYDKPSLLYSCNNCDQAFQNPNIKGKCHHCGADTRVEHLIKKEIKKYQITAAGKQAASGQFSIDLNNSGGLKEIMDESYLVRYLNKFIEHKKKGDEEGGIAEMHFTNISALYKQIGPEQTDELIKELHQIIVNDTLATDEVIFPNKFTARLLLTEKDIDESKELLNDIAATLHELISDNFDGFEVDISMQVQAVNTDETAQEQINMLNKEAVEK